MPSQTFNVQERLVFLFILAISLAAVGLEWHEGSISASGFLTGVLLLGFSAIYLSRRGESRSANVITLIGLIVSTHLLVLYSGKGDSALYSFYFIPILFAAARFGLNGSVLAGIGVTVLYASFFIHATMDQILAELLEETITLMFIALLAGYLVARLQEEEKKRLFAERSEKDRERLAEIGLLAAQIAHEFRNPLQVIEGAGETLDERKWIAEAGRSLLSDLRNEARRMSELATDFLSYGKPGVRELARVQLRELVEHASLGATGLRVRNSIPEEIAIGADKDSLERVFRNLLTNSQQARAKSVSISAEADGLSLSIRIEDDGCGIPEAISEKLFQPFRTGRAGGTGLGLAISRRIIEAHGGTLELEKTSSAGTAFLIRLKKEVE